ncbi:hypothetical protein [Streptacidiphilus sp. EB129]|uniref:hypothetical protein n=1 Tax=Streptacidiphilus sp. EB129 TaxID=3156262 RepID=UPI003518C155
MQSVTSTRGQTDRQPRPQSHRPITGSLSTGNLSSGLLSGGLRSMGGALRRAESVLLGGGQQTARRNAWDAVCENRRYAQDREDVEPVRLRPAR